MYSAPALVLLHRGLDEHTGEAVAGDAAGRREDSKRLSSASVDGTLVMRPSLGARGCRCITIIS